MITGEGSRKLSAYNLKATDTQKERRNFEGRKENTYYTLADMQAWNQWGTTDTDKFTEGNPHRPHGDGYAEIYKKQGPKMRMNGMSPRATEN